MQGASPLASPGLNPRGTYRTCQAGARSGALPLAGRGWVAFRYPCNRVGRGTGTTIGIRSFYRKSKGICLFMDSAGSQGEGGPGEMELSVANATAAFEMVLSPGAGITSAVGGQGEQVPPGCMANRRPSERHLTRPALLFPFPPAQCGRDRPAPCAFPQHPGRKEWWSGHG